MSKPLVITSRAHPDAVGVYLMQVILGIVLLIKPGHASGALARVMDSHLWATVWMGLVIVFALAALGSVLARAKDEDDLRAVLLVEAVACSSLTVLLAVYTIALACVFGWSSLVTISFVALFSLMDLTRGVQALLEVRRMNRALDAGQRFDISSLAEPEADHTTIGE